MKKTPAASHRRGGARLFGSRATTLAVAGVALGLSARMEARATDLEAAHRQFLTSCGTCHAVGHGDAHRQGPNLFGVYGQAAGSRVDFAYSAALKDAGWIWDETTLDPWI